MKRALFTWFGACLHANRARKQLANTMGGGGGADGLQQQSDLASDGFLLNIASLLVKLCGPLLGPQAFAPQPNAPKQPLDMVKPSFVSSDLAKAILPDLAGETRMNHTGQKPQQPAAEESEDFPLLTDLFFLAHSALRLAFPPLMALHAETNRQLHQWEQEAMSRMPGGAFNPMMAANDNSQEGKITDFYEYALSPSRVAEDSRHGEGF